MRYLPLTAADRRQMLDVIGAKAIDDLYVDVPAVGVSRRPSRCPRTRAKWRSSAS